MRLVTGLLIFFWFLSIIPASEDYVFEACVYDFRNAVPPGTSSFKGSSRFRFLQEEQALQISNENDKSFGVTFPLLPVDSLWRKEHYKYLEINYKGDGKPGFVTMRIDTREKSGKDWFYYVHVPMEFSEWRTVRLSGFWSRPGTPAVNFSALRNIAIEGSGPRTLLIKEIKLAAGRKMQINRISRPIVFVPLLKGPVVPSLDSFPFDNCVSIDDLRLKDRNVKAAYPSGARMIFSGSYLFCDVLLSGENPANIPARKREHDDHCISDDSCLEIYFDPGCTGKKIYQYVVNALGARSEIGEQVLAWNADWESLVSSVSGGWFAKLRFDLKSMGDVPVCGDVWGFNMKRHVADSVPGKFKEVSGWSGVGFNDPQQLGLMVFGSQSESSSAIKNIELFHENDKNFLCICEPVNASAVEINVELRIKAPRCAYKKIGEYKVPCSDKIKIPFTYEIPEDGSYSLILVFRDSSRSVMNICEFSTVMLAKPVIIPASEIVLCPEPQEIKKTDAYFDLKEKMNIAVSGKGDAFPAEHLSEMLGKRYGIKAEVSFSPADILLKYADPASMEQEGFKLSIGKEGISIEAADNRGMYYGVRALLDVIAQSSIGSTPRAQFLECRDWPAAKNRVLQLYFQEHYPRNPGVNAVKKFIYDLVAGGRYNILIIDMRCDMEFKSHPEVTFKKTAFSQGELLDIIAFARRHYLEVVPSNNAPGHCDWLLKSHPEFGEPGNSSYIMCSSNQASMRMIKDLYSEMIDVFKPKRFFHLNGDEVMWKPVLSGKECGYCKDFSKPDILLRYWNEMGAFCQERGLRPIIFSDMLSKTWHGGSYGTDKILPQLPKYFIIAQWGEGQYGIPPEQIKKAGFEAWRINTSFSADRMSVFQETFKYYDADGIALTIIWPWCNFGMYPTKTVCDYTCPAIFSNSACIWKPDVSGINRDTLITTRGNHWSRVKSVPEWGAFSLSLKALPIDSAASVAPAGFQEFPVGQFDVEKIPFARPEGSDSAIVVGCREKTASLKVDSKVRGLFFLHTLYADKKEEEEIRKIFRYKNTHEFGMPVAYYVVKYEDGSVVREPALLGWNIHFSDCIPAARVMLDAITYSVVANGEQQNSTAWVKAWKNPRPDVKVESISIEGVDMPGKFIVLGVSACK